MTLREVTEQMDQQTQQEVTVTRIQSGYYQKKR